MTVLDRVRPGGNTPGCTSEAWWLGATAVSRGATAVNQACPTEAWLHNARLIVLETCQSKVNLFFLSLADRSWGLET